MKAKLLKFAKQLKKITRVGLHALLLTSAAAFAINAQPPSHDPSTMIRNNDGRYWIFTTGEGIWCMSASNPEFTDWRAEPTPFGDTWPAWIDDYVTGFEGNFWAPDIVRIGSTYYLYYSCAGEGAPAAIGLVTAPDLLGPWTDQGMIVAGNNAIDPAILIDGTRMWMSWGNWQSGIDICELDITTGKRLNTSQTHLVDGQVEGPALLRNGSYYYLFYQRGLCCDGVNSGYYPVVARSTSVTGPYTGERVFLPNRDGNVIGPGHIGYGESKLTYHYYSKKDRGAAKLMITTLGWGSDGWPVSGTQANQLFASGTYKLVNRASRKYLDNLGSASDGTDVAHNASTGSNNQLWELSFLDGYYKLRCVTGGKFLDNIHHTTDGSTVGQLGNNAEPSQQWFITPEANAYYHITNRANGKCVDTGGSMANLDPVEFWYSNASNNQQWTLQMVSSASAEPSSGLANRARISDPANVHGFGLKALTGIARMRYHPVAAQGKSELPAHAISAFPNPATENTIRISTTLYRQSTITIDVVNQRGEQIYHRDLGRLEPGKFVHDIFLASAPGGVYIVRLRDETGVLATKKILSD